MLVYSKSTLTFSAFRPFSKQQAACNTCKMAKNQNFVVVILELAKIQVDWYNPTKFQ